MGHSNFCEGYRLEVIFRFYLTFTTVFVCLFVFILWVCLLLFEGGACCFVLFVLGFVSLLFSFCIVVIGC